MAQKAAKDLKEADTKKRTTTFMNPTLSQKSKIRQKTQREPSTIKPFKEGSPPKRERSPAKPKEQKHSFHSTRSNSISV